MASNPLTRRSRILGLPIGPRRIAWDEVISWVRRGLAVVATGLAVFRLVDTVKKILGSAPARTAEHILEEGEELLEEGHEAVGKVNQTLDTVNTVTSRVAGGSKSSGARRG